MNVGSRRKEGSGSLAERDRDSRQDCDGVIPKKGCTVAYMKI